MSDLYSQAMSSQNITNASLALANTHYENFPVASILLPMRLRKPIGLIYSFARQADDFADEGNLRPDERLSLLDGFRRELNLIKADNTPSLALFVALQVAIEKHRLPLTPFYDLLDAFSQDVVKPRYENFDEVMDYCRRSANPVGRLVLHLYGAAIPRNIEYSDAICSALQIINFLQDVAIDYKKNRIYFPLDEMHQFNIGEHQIASSDASGDWGTFMAFEINRARTLLYSGAPLGQILPGRFGLEMRTIVAGGERILYKLEKVHGNMFHKRPVLNSWDWTIMLCKALLNK